MLIECDRCAVRGVACSDCVVTALLDTPSLPDASSGRDLDEREGQALRVLAQADMVAPLRLVAPRSEAS